MYDGFSTTGTICGKQTLGDELIEVELLSNKCGIYVLLKVTKMLLAFRLEVTFFSLPSVGLSNE